MPPRPQLRWLQQPQSTPARIVLVLHGGQEYSTRRVTAFNTSWLRMWDFARAIRAASDDVGVALLRHAVRGWNSADDPAPVRDARAALQRIRDRHPDAQVVVLGHSMGGRTAARLGGDDNVVGVCTLAPWLPPGESVDHFKGQRFAAAHGTADTWTLPSESYEFSCAVRAAGGDAARAELPGAGHFLLRQPRLWRQFAVRVSLGMLGALPMPQAIQAAFDDDGDATLRIRLVT